MRIRTPFLRTSAAAIAFPMLFSAPYATGADNHWSAAGSPRDGNWDTTTSNWNTLSGDAGTVQMWTNGSDTAVFNNAEDGAVSLTETITAGGIDAGDGGTYTITGDTIVAAGPSLDVNVGTGSSGILNISSTLDAAQVTKQGDGTLVLSGGNIVAGADLDIQDGTLQLVNDDTVNSLLIGSGAPSTLSGGGTLTAGTYTLLDGAVIAGNLGEGTFVKGDAGTVTITGTAGSDVVNVTAGTLVLSGGNLDSDAALSTMGPGVVELNGPQTVASYSQGGVGGLTTTAAGVLTATSGATLSGGSVSAGLVGDVTTNGPVTITATGSVGGGFLNVAASTLTLDGIVTSTPVTIASGATLDDNAGGLDSAAAVTNEGTLNVNNVGDTVATYVSNGGTLGGNSPLTTTGGATLNDGSMVTTVLIGNTQTSGTVGISGGAALTGGNLTVNNGTLSVTGGAAIQSDTFVDDGTLSLNGGLFSGSILTVGDTAGAPSSAVVESLAPGQLGLNTAAVTVNSDGKLIAFDDSIASLDVMGGVVDTGAGASGLTVAGPVTLQGAMIEGSSRFFVTPGVVTVNASADSTTISAPVELGPATTFDVANGAAAQDLVISGLVTGGSLDFVGAGTLVLSNGANAQAGTTINGGTLRIEADGAAGLGDITVLGSTIDYADGVNVANPVDLHANVDLNVDPGASATQTGTIFETGGSFGITKTGGGTLDLAGANTYTGATNVNAGTLVLSGTLSALTDVTNAATLEVNTNNTVNTYVSNGGLLSGGSTLTATGGATLNDGSSVTGKLSGDTTTNGTVSISGAVDGGTLDVNGVLTTISSSFSYPVININNGQLSLTGMATTFTGTTVNVGPGTTFENSADLKISFNVGGGSLIGSGGTISGVGVSDFDSVSLTGDTLSGNVFAPLVNLNDGTTISGSLLGDTVTTNGNVSVTGLLGDGTLTRGSGSSTVTGGTTTVATGTLTLSGAGQLTNPTINISGPATLDDQNGGITDSAAVTNAGILNVDMDDTVNTYVSNGGTLSGMATLTATNGATLNNGSSVTGKLSGNTTSDGAVNVSGMIGGGSLSVNGGVLTLTMTGVSTNNLVSINNGAQLVDNGDLGDTANVVNNEGTLTVNVMELVGTYTSGGGAGTALLDGPGTLTASSYDLNDKSVIAGNLGNGPVTTEGSVMITATGTTGTGPLTVLNGLTTNAGMIGGNVVVTGGTFDNNNMVAGNLENSAFANNNSSLTGNFVNYATGTGTNSGTVFSNLDNQGTFTNTGTVVGTTVNTGDLSNTGAGLLTGDVTNNAGSLTTDADGIGDAATLQNNALVTLTGNDTIFRYISDAGTLAGGGILTATNGVDLNDMSIVSGNLRGDTTSDGAVSVTGTIGGGSLSVDSGVLTIIGSSTNTPVTIQGGATLVDMSANALGDTADVTNGGLLVLNGTETVGTYHNLGMGTLQVNIDSPVLRDRLIAGTVTLDPGSTLRLEDTDLALGEIADIIDGTITGTFAFIDPVGGTGDDFRYSFNPNTGEVQAIAPVAIPTKPSNRLFNLTENQTAAIGTSFEDSYIDPAGGGGNFRRIYYREVDPGNPDPALRWMQIPAADATLGDTFVLDLDPGLGLMPTIPGTQARLLSDAIIAFQSTYVPGVDVDGNPVVLAGPVGLGIANSLSPEVHQGMGDFTEQAMRRQVRQATRTAPIAKVGKGNVFAAVHTSSAGSSSSRNNADYDIKVDGVVAGARYEVMPGLQIGALLGADNGSIEGALIDTDGSGFVVGIFGEYVINPDTGLTVFSSLSYGDYEYDAARRSFGGLAIANGIGSDALEFVVGVEGPAWQHENFSLRPMAALRYMTGDVDGFTERGPGVQLMVNGYDIDSLLLEIGVNAEIEINEVVTLTGHLGFVTDFEGSGNSISSTYVGGGTPFTVSAPGVDDEALVLGLGAYFDVTEAFQLGVNWRTEFRSSSQSVNTFGVGAAVGF